MGKCLRYLSFAISVSLIVFILTLKAASQCKWDFSGNWDIKQRNGILVKMVVKQNGNTISGTASYQGRRKVERGTIARGLITQKPGKGFFLPVNKLAFEIKWDYGETGVYSGDFDGYGPLSGRLRGGAYIKEDPNNKSRQTEWDRVGRAPCK